MEIDQINGVKCKGKGKGKSKGKFKGPLIKGKGKKERTTKENHSTTKVEKANRTRFSTTHIYKRDNNQIKERVSGNNRTTLRIKEKLLANQSYAGLAANLKGVIQAINAGGVDQSINWTKHI
eukprot:6492454-Amphidinium_carterae.2